MAKKKVEMKNLGKAHTKEFLQMVHPFLKKEYRPLEKKELNNEEVFKELFGEEEPYYSYKLRAVYEYQK